MIHRISIALFAASLLWLPAARAADTGDPYEHYVNTSKDFQPVPQDKAWAMKAFPSWVYMPWTFKWSIGYTDASGKWSLDHGFNGAFIDHGHTQVDGVDKLAWIDKFHLRFYVDHTAGKHTLHIWDGGDFTHRAEYEGTGVRTVPVNAELWDKLTKLMQERINNVKSSPWRAAYALDDELSWGHFEHPAMWQVTDDKSAYPKWLKEIYGKEAPVREKWFSYNDFQPRLATIDRTHLDASPLMDQWTFNDSFFNNFIGDLVKYGNSVDPETPVGYVGGQTPSAFGGYDYAKIMRKVQFIEAYNLGSSQAIIRSFNPHAGLPQVTTAFHERSSDDIWQTWYYLAHGNRGFIGWVEGWFEEVPGQPPATRPTDVKLTDKPKAWIDEVAPTYLEANNKIGPLAAGAEWIHDGVAIYYSQASIQMGWIMDADPWGDKWGERPTDWTLGTSHLVAHAWENMLRDSGLQYNWLSYVDVIQHGIPKEYKVVILPACLCLSDAEVRQIKEYVQSGGTVIADYMPALWDQHGKPRMENGALDEFFGVRTENNLKAANVFGGKYWCEIDQKLNAHYQTYSDFMVNGNTCLMEHGYDKAVRVMPTLNTYTWGKGTAVLMNLSPQWYNAYRQTGYYEAARRREVFMKPLADAGPKHRVDIKDVSPRAFGYEITYFKKDGRTILFVTLNPEITSTETTAGNAAGLKTSTLPITLAFTHAVKGARDERTGKDLGDGKEFKFDWKMNEAVVLSFEGEPRRD